MSRRWILGVFPMRLSESTMKSRSKVGLWPTHVAFLSLATSSSATSSNGTASAHFSGVYPLTRSASTEAVSMCFGRIFRTQVSVISPRCVYGAVIFSRTMDTSRSSPLSRPSSRSVVSVSTKMR